MASSKSSARISSGWQLKRVDELGKVQAGRQRSPHFQEGALRPYLRVANIFDGYIDTSDVLQMLFTDNEFERYRLEPGDILLNEGQSLELVGRCAMYNGVPQECCFQNTLVRFRANASVDPPYMLNLFRHLQQSGKFEVIASQTTSIAHLGVSRFAGMKVLVPSKSEQRAIDRVLALWDRAIKHAERLLVLHERRKRTLMQQLLTGKRRFREFTARWRTFCLSDLFEPVYRTATNNIDAVLSISSRKGFERQEKKFSKIIAGKNLENYVLLRRGEFAYNKGNSKTYPQGCVFRLDDYSEAAVPNVYFCFGIKNDSATDSDFFGFAFEAGLLNSGLRGLINTGVRNNGLLNIYEPDFYALTLRCPNIAEQRRIAAVLNTCDAELRHLRAQVDALKLQKKGLMQRLLTGEVRVPVNRERVKV